MTMLNLKTPKINSLSLFLIIFQYDTNKNDVSYFKINFKGIS